ncbi:Mss4-like protein [Ilyonectria destructans]|nr:Mss4-like protein [Ilyonectria destructans]
MLPGSCLCGAIRYELDITNEEASKILTSHCRPCRKISGGTMSLNLTVQPSSFKLRKGFQFALAFCGDCGSPIYAEPHVNLDAKPGSRPYIIQAGTLDDARPLEAPPFEEVNIKHRLGWVGAVVGAEQKNDYF